MINEKKLIEDILQHENVLASANHVYKSGYRDRQDEIIDIINRQPKVGEWMPCSEGLPEDEGIMYWTTHEDGSIVMHGYTKKNGFVYNWKVDGLEKRKRQGGVIAWMPLPLPEPWKGEVNE